MSKRAKDRPLPPRPSLQRTASPTSGYRRLKIGFLSAQMCLLIGLYVGGFYALYEGLPWRRVTVSYQEVPLSEVVKDLRSRGGLVGITDRRSRPADTDGFKVIYRTENRRINEVLRDISLQSGVALGGSGDQLTLEDGGVARPRTTANDLYDRMDSLITKLTGLNIW